MMIQQFNNSIDVTQSLLWQYNNATNIIQLINNKQNFITNNYENFWNDWYTDVFNLTTANSFGLCVWSQILGLPFLVGIAPENSNIWGFNQLEGGTIPPNSNKNFGWGSFSALNDAIVINIEQQRSLLLLRYFQLQSRGSIVEINQYLNYLTTNFTFPACTVTDGLNMTMTYTFSAALTPPFYQAISTLNVLPKPAGVSLTIVNP